METVNNILGNVNEFFNSPLFRIDGFDFTLWILLYLALLIFALFFITARLNRLIVYRLLSGSKVELGVRIAVGSIVRYLVIVIGLIVIFQTAGVNLSSITIIFGALGVGIGFGLQNITNNFVSGLIILLERPIKVGDRIEVSGVAGNVVKISMRATTIITNDNITIIVPNSEFISGTVINWSHTNRQVRFHFPIKVSYREDPERVKRIVREIASEHPGILKVPKPNLLFREFGDSSLDFELRVWTKEFTDRPGMLKSQLYYKIFARFRQEGIEIPYNQLDVHLRELPQQKPGSDPQRKNDPPERASGEDKPTSEKRDLE